MLLRPSQHSSLSGIRTALIFHDAMASIAASSTGPSQTPYPCTHMNSPPDRFTPRRRTVVPLVSTSLLPETCSAGAGPVDPPPPPPPPSPPPLPPQVVPLTA